MCPLVKSEMKNTTRIGLQGWKDGESKTLKFLDNGTDLPNGRYGLTYVYQVKEGKEEKSLWIKPSTALAIGLQDVVNAQEKGDLKGLSMEITKALGKTQKDTRYHCKVV